MKILNIVLEALFDASQSYHENNLIKAQIKDKNEVLILASTRKSRDKNDSLFPESEETVYEKAILIRKNIKYRNFLVFGKIIDADIDGVLKEIEPDMIVLHGLSSYTIKHVFNYKKSHQDVYVIGISHLDEVIFDISKFKNKLYKCKFQSINKIYGSCINDLYGVTSGRAKFLKTKLGFKDRDVKVTIMGGIDNVISNSKSIIDREPNCFYFYSGGKLDDGKRIVELVKAFNSIKLESIRLVLFGSISDSCKEKINNVLLTDKRIIQINWLSQSEIKQLVNELDCALFPGQHSVLWEQILFYGKTGIFGEYSGVEHIFEYGNAIPCRKDASIEEMADLIQKVALNNDGIYMNALANAKRFSYKFDIVNNWKEIKDGYESQK